MVELPGIEPDAETPQNSDDVQKHNHVTRCAPVWRRGETRGNVDRSTWTKGSAS